ncbi:hypothetical protein K458DRAFT_407730 [Lentithecium fluviatile CBS 122367]|uniref:Uncharacterized protein n=1 Tax=Lentithecium fluviatile CBS 122367 TaxID=1168545 RepID=A0A6G1INT8_9PLEO|nr:hypothetical protein K458DRAFT_407730 [Lentithecium fluviatile CBS 122367]
MLVAHLLSSCRETACTPFARPHSALVAALGRKSINTFGYPDLFEGTVRPFDMTGTSKEFDSSLTASEIPVLLASKRRLTRSVFSPIQTLVRPSCVHSMTPNQSPYGISTSLSVTSNTWGNFKNLRTFDLFIPMPCSHNEQIGQFDKKKMGPSTLIYCNLFIGTTLPGEANRTTLSPPSSRQLTEEISICSIWQSRWITRI